MCVCVCFHDACVVACARWCVVFVCVCVYRHSRDLVGGVLKGRDVAIMMEQRLKDIGVSAPRTLPYMCVCVCIYMHTHTHTHTYTHAQRHTHLSASETCRCWRARPALPALAIRRQPSVCVCVCVCVYTQPALASQRQPSAQNADRYWFQESIVKFKV
jgi:hypothetical protein